MFKRFCVTLALLLAALLAQPPAALAVLTQGNLTNTNQAITTDATYTNVHAAVNFRYSTQGTLAAPFIVNGVTYQNYDWLGGTQVLTGGASLAVSHSGGDGTFRARSQNTAATISGTNDTVLESLANTINYYDINQVGTFTLSGLPAHRAVKVQFFGGDDGAGWTGTFGLISNGNSIGTWNATDANNATSTFATFDGVTTGDGRLVIQATRPAGSFAGIAGMAVVGATARQNFVQEGLTSTAQLLGPDANFNQVEAALNFHFPTLPGNNDGPSPGVASTPVNGVSFQNINWNGGPQALADGGTITITGQLPLGSRSQTTAATISGAGETILEGVANTMGFWSDNEGPVNFNLTGLLPNREMRVQVIGGDAGGNLGNWLADVSVSANGQAVGLWDAIADDNAATANLLTFYAMSDAAGNLTLSFDPVDNVGGSLFLGISGLVVTASSTPEPPTWIAMALIAPALVVGHWLLRRRQR